MKWYHWLAIAIVGAYLVWPKKKRIGSGTTLPTQYQKPLIQIVTSQDPGNSAQYDTDPKNYEAAADQKAYPGWYRSKVDGTWYNPDTGDFFSAGSSPAAIGPSYYDLHPEARVQIDLTTVVPNSTPNRDGYVIY